MNKQNRKIDFSITVLIVIGILIVINFLSYNIFFRWDLTQNKDYSISDVSKNIAKNLDDIVNIKLYFSETLPKQYVTLPQEVGDLLDEYANYSNGNIQIEFINPDELENADQELYRMGIPALQFNVLEKDKYESIKGYLGMVIQYGAQKEVIPVVNSTENLEYQTTLAIKKLTTDDIATLGILADHGTKNKDEDFSTAYKKLQEIYSIQNVTLSEKNPQISDSIDVLLIVGPTEEFNEDQLKAIDKFIMRGGSLLVANDGVKIESGLVPIINENKLNILLEKYGITLNKNLALDSSSGMAAFSSGFFTLNTNYPFWPLITKSGFDQDNASVSKLESVLLPWVSTIDINKDKINSENKISYLIQTSESSWTQEENFNLDPQQKFLPTNTGRKLVAVSVFGKFKSAYGDETSDDSRIIVIGDSDFISDNFLRQTPDNLTLFQNLVDSLALDNDLINIRSKGITSRPIKELSDSEKASIRYLNVFGVTVVVIAYGMIRYYRRKKSKFVDEL